MGLVSHHKYHMRTHEFITEATAQGTYTNINYDATNSRARFSQNIPYVAIEDDNGVASYDIFKQDKANGNTAGLDALQAATEKENAATSAILLKLTEAYYTTAYAISAASMARLNAEAKRILDSGAQNGTT